MHRSTKDTVKFPVKITTLECGYEGCLFQTRDHVPGTLEEVHKCLLETHVELEHLAVDKNTMGCICPYAATYDWSGTRRSSHLFWKNM